MKKTDRSNLQKNNDHPIFKKIPNPFSAYDIESGKWFYHEDVINKVKNEFDSLPPRKVIVIHGFIGSGKTSTLLRMADEPELLGKKYIPIYFNISDTAIINIGGFLLYLYQSIKDTLGLLGYTIDRPNYSFNPSVSVEEMVYFINKVEEKIKDHVIVLIVDDFEKIQQRTAPKTMIAIREFFEYLLGKPNFFRLIMAGKGDIFKIAQGTDMSYLVNVAFKIELGMFLERKKIEKLIVGPVKKFVHFESQAISKIVEVTGRNLYCQQLLCHYLINCLNEEKSNQCGEHDVLNAIQKTIRDKREDFSYFWDQLSTKKKLIMSAMADDGVMKKRGRYYFIEESPLLDLFFNEFQLNQLLEKLATEQHISPIKGKRFDGNPFTIPLYGAWIKYRHPLKQTVLKNWQELVEGISLPQLGKLMHAIPITQIPLEREIIKKTKRISKKWSVLQSDFKQRKLTFEKVDRLLQWICELFGFDIIEKPSQQKNYFTINMSRLSLSVVEKVMIFVPLREELTDMDISYIKDEILVKDKPSIPSFILCFKKTDEIIQLAQKPFLGIVLIEEKDLKRCLLSSTPVQVLKKEVIIKQIRPSVVSPYKTEGPVRITFYGRQDEIGRILRERYRNFAVVGARKIGKTSLLLKTISELPPNSLSLYMDLETPENQNYETFLSALSENIEDKYNESVNFCPTLSNFASIIKKLGATGKKPAFFLDEVDLLLKYDKQKGFKLLTIFRALAQERYCQVVMSGFKELYLARMGLDSPLYNFLEIITLDRLKEKDALTLISEPMEAIGIEFAKKEDKKSIIQYTSSHPNLIQFFCKGLIEIIQEKDEHQHQRTIFQQDIYQLFDSFEFENYVVNDFYLFYTKDILPIERLIILLLLNRFPNKDVYSATEIIETLKESGFTFTLGDLAEYLTSLCLRYIFAPERGGTFRFALPIFPKILKKRYHLDHLIKETIEDAKKSL